MLEGSSDSLLTYTYCMHRVSARKYWSRIIVIYCFLIQMKKVARFYETSKRNLTGYTEYIPGQYSEEHL